jgi:hypothetical protein
MRFRKLRIAWSVVCGIACVLVIVLWVRSYWWLDLAIGKHGSLHSLEGCILCGLGEDPTRQQVFIFSQNLNEMHQAGSIIHSGATHGFLLRREPKSLRIGLPHWLLAFASVCLAAAPWIRWKLSFSLRTLLIGTTTVAVVLGLVVYATRQ